MVHKMCPYNMKTKLTLVTVVVVCFVAVFAYAQVDESSPDDIFVRMKAELNLTQAQIDSIKPIIEEYSAKLQQLEQGLKDDKVFYDLATSNQIKKLREEENQKLIRVLTPDQAVKWKNKQGLRNFFNNDQTGDRGWEPKVNGGGMGVNF